MPFFNTRTGDRPQFPLTNERLDKPDLAAIADYLNETLVRMLGALLGPSSGVLSNVTFDYATPGQVGITNRCLFAYAWPEVPGDNGTLQGGVVIHDPARQSQPASLVDLSAAVAGQAAWIWFQRVEVPTHTATRRNWVVGAEGTAPALTLIEEGVVFYATTTTAHATINEANGFFKFGAVAAADWAAGAPTYIRALNFPDGGQFTTTATMELGTVTEFTPGNLSLGGDNTGLARQLRWLFAKVSQIMDSDNTYDAATVPVTTGAVGWADDPTAGLSQLSAADAAMQADIATAQADIAGLRTDVDSVVAILSMELSWNGGTLTYSAAKVAKATGVVLTVPSVETIAFGNGWKARIVVDTQTAGLGQFSWHVTGDEVAMLTETGDTAQVLAAEVYRSSYNSDRTLCTYDVVWRSTSGELQLGNDFCFTLFGMRG